MILADWELSPNNKFLAVAEDFKGRRKKHHFHP